MRRRRRGERRREREGRGEEEEEKMRKKTRADRDGEIWRKEERRRDRVQWLAGAQRRLWVYNYVQPCMIIICGPLLTVFLRSVTHVKAASRRIKVLTFQEPAIKASMRACRPRCRNAKGSISNEKPTFLAWQEGSSSFKCISHSMLFPPLVENFCRQPSPDNGTPPT